MSVTLKGTQTVYQPVELVLSEGTVINTLAKKLLPRHVQGSWDAILVRDGKLLGHDEAPHHRGGDTYEELKLTVDDQILIDAFFLLLKTAGQPEIIVLR